jgi:hypothetical protein
VPNDRTGRRCGVDCHGVYRIAYKAGDLKRLGEIARYWRLMDDERAGMIRTVYLGALCFKVPWAIKGGFAFICAIEHSDI